MMSLGSDGVNTDMLFRASIQSVLSTVEVMHLFTGCYPLQKEASVTKVGSSPCLTAPGAGWVAEVWVKCSKTGEGPKTWRLLELSRLGKAGVENLYSTQKPLKANYRGL